MLELLVSEYLRKLHKLQLEHAEELNTFAVETRYDSYYGVYLYATFSDDNGKYVASFVSCITEEDFEKVYQHFEELVNDGRR